MMDVQLGDDPALDKLQSLDPKDRAIILKEIEENPAFGERIKAILLRPDGLHELSTSARHAFANEIDPLLFPETKGTWLSLRRTVQNLLRAIPIAIRENVEATPLKEKLRIVEQIASGRKLQLQLAEYPVESLAQDFLGSIITAVSGAASSIYSSSVTASAQRAIAKMQSDAQLKQLDVNMTLAKAQAAITGAQAQILTGVSGGAPGTAGTGLSTTVAGVPLWGIGLGVVAAIGILVLAFK
ncbi:MAG: hypothetical protein ACREYE_22210 [Gammaproteobacteria bacterium]